MAKQYHITRQEGPDYYPLTTQEVIGLLDAAIALEDHKSFHPEETKRGIHSIAMRLGQGIPGKVSPLDEDSSAGVKVNKVYEVYSAWLEDPDTLFLKEQPLTESSDIVVTLTNLMK